MILQSLNELYTRLSDDPSYEIAPPGFSPQKVCFRIVIKEDGTLVNIEDARIPDAKGKMQNSLILIPGDTKPPGAGINPCFLWDNQTYLLGKQPEDKPAGFGLKRFEAFRHRHLNLESSLNNVEFSAVCRFLEKWNPESLIDFPILEEVGTGFGIFQLQGRKQAIHESSEIKQWWIERLSSEVEGEIAQCLLSGENAPIARLHPKIRGVTGSQAMGANLVSFDKPSFRSYRKDQSFNSPVSSDSAFRYGTALNSLLIGPQSRKHRLRIGDTTTVFWTEKPNVVEDIFANLFSGGSQAVEAEEDVTLREQLKRLLEAVRSGGGFQELSETETSFHILGLAPNAARLSVRFYHRTSIADLLTKLHDHQACLKIVREFTNKVGKRFPDPEFPAIWQILRETARVADEIPPLLAGALTRSIVTGGPYPDAIFSSIIRRIHADRVINYLRAATLKAVLIRNHNQPISDMLDTKTTDPAYLLGRLFSALEKTQEDALGNVNAGLRHHFYSSASATPASVFPRILRTYQHHLSKLQGGVKVNRERLVQDILSSIESSGFPNQLALKKQGTFAIGYYHQRKDFFTKKETPNTEN